MSKKFLTLGLIATSLSLVNCSKDNKEDNPAPVILEATHKNVINNITLDVIVGTYKDMDEKADLLKQAIRKFTNSGGQTEANLEAVKKAWVDVRKSWEQSEGFLFGPVSNKGLDPAMDSWPVDVDGMNNIINADRATFEKFSEDEDEDGKISDEELNTNITVNVISANNNTRGFHLIEFLVWGDRGADGKLPVKKLSAFTPRQLEYLLAAAQDLKNTTAILYEDWREDAGNWASYFLNFADTKNPLYSSATAVYEQLIDGMVEIANEVTSKKIADSFVPGGTPSPADEESRFSKNSTTDFADNIRSIQNIYLGQYNGKDVLGLTDIISKANANLDTQMKAKLESTIKSIEAMGDFTDAIYNRRNVVQKATDEVADLRDFIEKTLKPYVTNNIK